MGTPLFAARACGTATALVLAWPRGPRRHRLRGNDPVAPRPRPRPRRRRKEVAWADMIKDQRIDYMKSVVLPRMKQAFTDSAPIATAR